MKMIARISISVLKNTDEGDCKDKSTADKSITKILVAERYTANDSSSGHFRRGRIRHEDSLLVESVSCFKNHGTGYFHQPQADSCHCELLLLLPCDIENNFGRAGYLILVC